MKCKATRQVDEWWCRACDVRWAVDDPLPDACQCAARPTVKQDASLMQRTLDALGISSFQLAAEIGVRQRDIDALCAPGVQADFVTDDTWQKVLVFVNKKAGAVLAVRDELNAASYEHKMQVAARHERVRSR